MIPLVLAAMFLGLVTSASGQRRGLPGGSSLSWCRPCSRHTSGSCRLARSSWKTGVRSATGLGKRRNSRRDRRYSCSGVRQQPGRRVGNVLAGGWKPRAGKSKSR